MVLGEVCSVTDTVFPPQPGVSSYAWWLFEDGLLNLFLPNR